jgi:hypothetical protein
MTFPARQASGSTVGIDRQSEFSGLFPYVTQLEPDRPPVCVVETWKPCSDVERMSELSGGLNVGVALHVAVACHRAEPPSLLVVVSVVEVKRQDVGDGVLGACILIENELPRVSVEFLASLERQCSVGDVAHDRVVELEAVWPVAVQESVEGRCGCCVKLDSLSSYQVAGD